MATVWNSSSFGGSDYHLSNSYENDNFLDLAFDELDLMICKLPSIQGDVEKYSSCSRSTSLSFPDSFDDMDLKPEIRNVDCMWSASANNSNNNGAGNHSGNSSSSKNTGGSNSAASSYSESSAVPPSVVSGGALLIKREPEEEVEQEQAAETEDEEEDVVAAATTGATTEQSNSSSSSISIMHNTSKSITIPRSQFQNNRCQVLKLPSNIKCMINGHTVTEQQIPPGASLLRKSNTSLAQHRQKIHPIDYRGSSSSFVRPKTPGSSSSSSSSGASASDEQVVFRHNVDLTACVMGSNNISLTNCADANYIDHLSRELQNTSKERIDMLPYRVPGADNIVDVLDVISQQSDMCSGAAVSTLSPPASSSDCDSDDGECSVVDSATSLDGNCMQHISDHSYTRCNEMETNLETPSDSDEEIDVVSLNDKKLPNNPSDRDRRILSKAINKNLGIQQPPKRAFSLPYTPASSSPVKSEANSRYPSPSPSPYVCGNITGWNTSSAGWLPPTRSESSSGGSDCTMQPTADQANSRKRLYKSKDAAYRVYSMKGFAAKKRVKKSSNETSTGNVLQQQQQPTMGANGSNSSSSANSSISSSSSSSSSSSILKRQFSLDEADTIEKRNQHNDMERQRRIGLKNLFEALKKQIPNIRDKERAPKVNILREAAKLCEQLTSEEREQNLKRQQLKAKLKQKQELLTRLRLSKNHLDE